ncbi:MAG: NUDIX domain-containing protein [Stellaceae bacterium]
MSDDAKILPGEPLYRGHFHLDRYRFRHRLHAGGWNRELSREVFSRVPTVAVLLYDPDRDAVVLVEQFRLPAQLAGASPWQIEVVAGLVDHGNETEEGVARRETVEEAGITLTGELLPMHRVLTSPGGSTESVMLYCARVDARTAGGIYGVAEEGEDIKVVVKPVAEAMAMLRSGAIENVTCVIALYWLAANRARLKRRWAHTASR